MANDKSKDIQKHSFEGGMNSDTADHLLPPNQARSLVNCRSYTFGKAGVITNVKGNTQIVYDLPDGINLTIGGTEDEDRNRIYFANYNSNGFHTWYILDTIHDKVSVLLQSRTDSDDVDILRFDPRYRIDMVDIIDHNLLYWVEYGLNKARKFNIQKMLDKSDTGYGALIQEEYITAYKLAPTYAPTATYFTDINRPSNELFGLMFKFMYRYIYDDGEKSNYSDYSLVPKPINQSYLGISAINTDNNALRIFINTGGRLVVKIELAVQINSLKPVTCVVIHKDELALTDNAQYEWIFYNDGAYTATVPEKIIRPYSYLPDRPKCQSKVRNAITYANFKEGWPKVAVNATIALTFEDIFLPDAEDDVLNNPSITVTELSHYSKSAGFLSGHWMVNITAFVIGSDVKRGNVYIITGTNGQTDNYRWTITATLADNAVSIANKLKAFLRATNRGIPTANDGVSNESVDMSGNVTFYYTYLGKYDENKTTFYGSVSPVNSAELKDNGFAIQVIQPGNERSYAVMYEDDDLRKSAGYTNDALKIRTPYINEPGYDDTKRAIHTISLFHQPPLKARYWQLCRTSDNKNCIDLLIQQVIDVTVTAQGEYLDLVVGSLFTYQKIHPNTILKYEFTKGDRLRIVKDETNGAFLPYYETEVLSYSINTLEEVNSQITVHGTNLVTPTVAPNPSYVGKNIVIEGVERTIIGISGGDYELDGVISVGTPTTPTVAVVGSFSYIDRRGIIRIRKPDSYGVGDFILVQLYKPVKNSDDSDYRIFQLCGEKYEISNYGTPQRAHRGNQQDQDGTSAASLISTPAVVRYDGGDVYVRFREMPTNNQATNVQVLIDHIYDPNWSDFYESNLSDLGLEIPQDNGAGEVEFPDRVRFSNKYIEDTQINGLNDFDNSDREDYNDAYGAIRRTLYHLDRLYMFKDLKDCWTPIFKSIIVDNSGQSIVATSSKLLNQLQYLAWQGGIGNNPESLAWNANYIYHASVGSGVFLRIAGDGEDPISTIYNYDKAAREILSIVGKYNLPLIAAVDREHGDVLWSYPEYIPYLFNDDFSPLDWETIGAKLPEGTTFNITQQPANSTASIVDGLFQIEDTGVLGDDYLLFEAVLPDTTVLPVKKFCFTVVAAPPTPPGYRVKDYTTTAYCIIEDGINNGLQNSTTLEGYNISDGLANGFIMPNIKKISPEAIVPDTATITYNQTVDVAPSGGSNDDLWYNQPADNLYKKITGTWTLLTNRSDNNFYVAPVKNLGDCPIPAPVDHFLISAQYGMTVTKVVDGTATGTPGTLNPISVYASNLRVAYVAVTAGTVIVTLTGSPVSLHAYLDLVINGVLKDSQHITVADDYTLTLPVGGATSPDELEISINLH